MKISFDTTNSFRRNAANKLNSSNYDSEYMYYKKAETKKTSLENHKVEYIAGIIASIAAIIALSRFLIKNTAPKNIVEIDGTNLGLNKKNINKDFAESVKETIFYPIMSLKNGQWRTLFNGHLANGIITAGKDSQKHSKAMIEHARLLGIHCIEIDPKTKHKNKLITSVYKAVQEAENYIAQNKKDCVIVDLGDIGNVFTLKKYKAHKEDLSKIENKLTGLPKRIIWSGWTENTEGIPYYYNNTPTKMFMLPE